MLRILGCVKVYYAQLVHPYPRSTFLGGSGGRGWESPPPRQTTVICENQLEKIVINFLGGCTVEEVGESKDASAAEPEEPQKVKSENQHQEVSATKQGHLQRCAKSSFKTFREMFTKFSRNF